MSQIKQTCMTLKGKGRPEPIIHPRTGSRQEGEDGVGHDGPRAMLLPSGHREHPEQRTLPSDTWSTRSTPNG